MLNTRKTLLNLVAAFALGGLFSTASAVENVKKKDLDAKSIARLEESASTSVQFETLARLYELRAEMLEEKVVRHERLEKRYAAAPASLLAKRGTAWNTPKRQRKLAWTARWQAAEAREMSRIYVAKADSTSRNVD